MVVCRLILSRVFFPVFLLLTNVSAIAQTGKGYNVLFIAVDDLRPELKCYGAAHMKTPNIDMLAGQGVLFERAYCQQALCAPSRNSIMTGLRPDAIGIYDLQTFFRTKVPEVVTLPEHFRKNGYHAESLGKIFHTAHQNQDDPQSWSVPSTLQRNLRQRVEIITRGDTTGLQGDFPKINGKNLPYYLSEAPEPNMTDAVLAETAVKKLEELRDSTFFLAVGFVKPHLPFVAPRAYWEMYDAASVKIPDRTPVKDMSPLASANSGELRMYHSIPQAGDMDDLLSRNLIHGYYASVSMIDAQIGKLLKALKENGLSEKTIVVLWGDHGFKLGEYGEWCKQGNLEQDTRVPLLISAPGIKKGVKTMSLAELVDVYPTLCDLAGIAKPSHLEGVSLLPVLKNPGKAVKKVAISQYPRGKSLEYDRKTEIMGYSIRTDRYRYTRWQKYENPDEVVDVELYDHRDTQMAGRNLARQPELKKELQRLDRLLTTELSRYTLLRPQKVSK